jgi:Tol biopolymer transport system component
MPSGPGRLVAGVAWLVLVFVLVLLASRRAWAGNPDLRMRTLETEHFHVHFYAGEEDLADRVGMIAERAHARLTVLMGHEPWPKVHILLEDDQDNANGFANVVPYPAIRLYASAPAAMSVLGNYDDWIDILVTHELLHIVHLDTIHGLPRLINAVLGLGGIGQVTAPNGTQPYWVIEGWATMIESDLTSAGRHRSALFDMMMRMAVLEGRFTTLDRVSNEAKIYPFRSSIYLYGLHFMHYLANRYGRDKLAELSHEYGGRIIPFGISRAIEDVYGVDLDTLWEEFRSDSTRRFQAEAREIRARGLRQGRRLTFSVSAGTSGSHARYPIWSRDDRWVYFSQDDGHRQPGIYRLPAAGGPLREGLGIGDQGKQLGIERVIENLGPSPPALVPGRDDIIYEMAGTHDFRYSWNDLYRWPGGDPRRREQLTFGMRAREPHVAPDGRTVVFVRADVGQTRLGFLDLDTGDVVEVAPVDRFQQIHNPRFSPDGRRVAFSRWHEGGYRDIWVYDRRDGKSHRITADRWQDQAPTWTPDGRWIVFTSDRGGVANLHAYDTRTERIWQVTNVLGGAFEPAVSHDGTRVAYVGYTSTGFDLWVMEWNPDRFLPALPALDPFPVPADPTPDLPGTQGRPPSTIHGHPYRALQTFYPRTIFPAALEFESSDSFLSALAATTEFADIAGFHSATLSFAYLPDVERASGSASYRFSRLFPDFALGVGRTYLPRTGFVRYVYDEPGAGEEDAQASYEREGYLERQTRASVQMDVPIVQHPRHNARAELDYDFIRYENVDADLEIVDPNAPASSQPAVGDLASLALGFSYGSNQSFRYSYGDELGRKLDFDIGVVDRRIGSDFSGLQVTGSYSEFVPMPWRGHQVLALRLSGGASTVVERPVFFAGGFSRDQDQIRTLLTRTPWGEAGVLRGYPRGALAGRYEAVLNAEYRVPIVDVDRGPSALPLLLERLVLAGFTDWGNAWDGAFRLRDLAGSVGANLIFGLRVGYGERIYLMLQYAHGIDRALGIDSFRAVVARSF